ncbi:MAG: hypothetical protein ACYS8W_16535 [Planctomycetota bacterium]
MRCRFLAILTVSICLFTINFGCGGGGGGSKTIAPTGSGTGIGTGSGTGSGTYTGPATPGPTGTGTMAAGDTWYAYGVPDGHDGSNPWPIVVFFHGGNVEATDGLDHGLLAAKQQNFIYIAPNSTGTDDYYGSPIKSWDWNNDTENIAECIKHAVYTWNTDLLRIYVIGHSLGSTMNVVFSTGPECGKVAAMSCFCATWPWPTDDPVEYGGGTERKVPALFSSQDGDGNFGATLSLQSIFDSNGHTTTFQDDSARLSGHTYDYQKIIDAYEWMSAYSL